MISLLVITSGSRPRRYTGGADPAAAAANGGQVVLSKTERGEERSIVTVQYPDPFTKDHALAIASELILDGVICAMSISSDGSVLWRFAPAALKPQRFDVARTCRAVNHVLKSRPNLTAA